MEKLTAAGGPFAACKVTTICEVIASPRFELKFTVLSLSDVDKLEVIFSAGFEEEILSTTATVFAFEGSCCVDPKM